MRLTIVNLFCLMLILVGPGNSAAADAFVGVVKTLEGGAGAHIRKPYTMEKIGLAVRRELDRK